MRARQDADGRISVAEVNPDANYYYKRIAAPRVAYRSRAELTVSRDID